MHSQITFHVVRLFCDCSAHIFCSDGHWRSLNTFDLEVSRDHIAQLRICILIVSIVRSYLGYP